MTPFSSTNQIEKDQRKKKTTSCSPFPKFPQLPNRGKWNTNRTTHTRRHITVSLLFLNFSQLPNRRKPKRKKKKTREIGTELGPADAGEAGVAAAIIERES